MYRPTPLFALFVGALPSAEASAEPCPSVALVLQRLKQDRFASSTGTMNRLPMAWKL